LDPFVSSSVEAILNPSSSGIASTSNGLSSVVLSYPLGINVVENVILAIYALK
jgi:hypothetical protein